LIGKVVFGVVGGEFGEEEFHRLECRIQETEFRMGLIAFK
jgi:hypothetical protein